MLKISPLRRTEIRWGLFFIAPWIIGYLLFTAVPMGASFYLSFTDYSPTRNANRPVWIGLDNYSKIFSVQIKSIHNEEKPADSLPVGYSKVTQVGDVIMGARDPLFWKSLFVTIKFGLISLPVGMTATLLISVLANYDLRGISLFRTIVYLPTMVPVVASAIVITSLFNREIGWFISLLRKLGLGEPDLNGDPDLVLLGLMIIGLWSAGNGMIMYLAGFQGVPTELYEAAKVDGANVFQRFRKITLPMISPIIFYNLVMGLIGTFQYYTTAYVLTKGVGGPNYSRYFFNMHITKTAFNYQDMGYASAMAWFLMVLVIGVTLFVFITAKSWVYYPGTKS